MTDILAMSDDLGPEQVLHLSNPAAGLADSQGSTGGVPAQSGHLYSVVGLVWRSVVLWMLLVALLSLANVVG